MNKTQSESQDAKVAELVLKCIWKLARNIPADLDKELLDPIEVFPAIEHSLQSIPPNDWRARAANKVPCGDMPLRTIKVIIQHIVGQFTKFRYRKIKKSKFSLQLNMAITFTTSCQMHSTTRLRQLYTLTSTEY